MTKQYDTLFVHMKECHRCMNAFTDYLDLTYCPLGMSLFKAWHDLMTMRKYEVFYYVEDFIHGGEFPISLGLVYMSGKRDEDAIAFPDETVWGYSYVEEP